MSYYNQCLTALHSLKQQHPKISLGKHLSSILDESDMWAISDKEIYNSLQEYIEQLALDVPHNDIDNIIKEGMMLDRYLIEEEGENDGC